MASSRPPRPASTAAASTPASANAASAVAVSVSNCVARSSSAGRATAARPVRGRARGRRRGSAPTSRSRAATYTPRRGRPRGAASPRSCAWSSTCRSCRRREWRVRELRVAELGEQRAHPLQPEAVHGPGLGSRATQPPMRIELAPVALELLALGLRRPRPAPSREPGVREHGLGRSISLRSRARSTSTLPSASTRLGLHDRVEDPLSPRPRARCATPLRRKRSAAS